MKNKFKELGISDDVVQAIEALGYEKPSKIQEQIIPIILKGNDVIGQAQTGTGKTLAFAASILSKMDVSTNIVKAIILVPTRELAIQVSEEFQALNRHAGFDILAVYGGSRIDNQIRLLKKGVDVVVGTPGRVMDLIKRRVLKIDHLEYFILDEADEMLNMGFHEDIEEIFKKTNDQKQVLLFSATMPKTILKLTSCYMKKDYQHIVIEETSRTSINVEQNYYRVNEKIRVEVLCRILDKYCGKTGIIFCQKKKEVDFLLGELAQRNYSVEAMHGDISQAARIETLERFKKKSFHYLIATDVAARGIHVDDIDLVINYNLPQDVESYIHRIGRTGRAGNKGLAISLVTNRQISFLNDVKKQANCKITECSIPNSAEIFEGKYQSILEEVHTNIENKSYEEYIKYVRDYNKDEVMKFAAALLKASFDRELGSDLEKDLKVEQYTPPKQEGTTRVFLTIGKLDNVKKGSLLDFLKEETKIRKENFTGIEILTKFTFLNVDDKVLADFIKRLKNKRFHGRVVRVERAKKR